MSTVTVKYKDRALKNEIFYRVTLRLGYGFLIMASTDSERERAVNASEVLAYEVS